MISHRVSSMRKSTWLGVAAGIGVAVAGAGAAYTYLGEPAARQPNVAGAAAQEECWGEQVATVAGIEQYRISGMRLGRTVESRPSQSGAHRHSIAHKFIHYPELPRPHTLISLCLQLSVKG